MLKKTEFFHQHTSGKYGPFYLSNSSTILKAPRRQGKCSWWLSSLKYLTWYRAYSSCPIDIWWVAFFFFFLWGDSWQGQAQLGSKTYILSTIWVHHMITSGFLFVVQILENWTIEPDKRIMIVLCYQETCEVNVLGKTSLHIRKMNFRPWVEAAQSPEGLESRARKPGSQEASSLSPLLFSL